MGAVSSEQQAGGALGEEAKQEWGFGAERGWRVGRALGGES